MARNFQIGSLVAISVVGFGFSYFALRPLMDVFLNVTPITSILDEATYVPQENS